MNFRLEKYKAVLFLLIIFSYDKNPLLYFTIKNEQCGLIWTIDTINRLDKHFNRRVRSVLEVDKYKVLLFSSLFYYHDNCVSYTRLPFLRTRI